MNSKNEENKISMLYVSFNQDNSFFSIGTDNGFIIYKTYPLSEPYQRNLNGGIGVVEMVNNSNFLLLIGGGETPRFGKNTLVIWDDHENKVISELKFTSSIKSCKYKKDYLFVICQKKIYVFNFNTYTNICSIETGDNTKELVAINTSDEKTVVVYPSKKAKNQISIKYLDNNKDNKENTFEAQEDSVSKISINNQGTLIATANEHGTVIRIHNTEGVFLQEFKRGHEKAIIHTICFNKDSKLMAISSSRGTIHIFSLGNSLKKLKESNNIKKADINKKNNLKTSDIKKEKKIEGEIITDDIKNEKNDKEFQKENENMIIEEKEGKKEENKINEKEEEIKIEKEETLDDDDELPVNTKTFFGGLFGSKTEKSFAKISIESQESICAFPENNKLVVISSDHKYTLIDIDLKSGSIKKKDSKDLILSQN